MKKNNLEDFQCRKCGICCEDLKRFSVMIFPEDISKLSEKLAINKRGFVETYCEFDEIIYRKQKIYLCYLKTDNTSCPFLKDKLCTVHLCKPIQCMRTPYHFFSYYDIWGYMPCVDKLHYPEGSSYLDDDKLIRTLLQNNKWF